MSDCKEIVFLFDFDNTLLDNDAVVADLQACLVDAFGTAESDRYWSIFEAMRAEQGYVDYLGALQHYRRPDSSDTRLLLMSSFLIDYPFASRLYPGARLAIQRLRRAGLTVILSDGDVVFQPRKIRRSGLWDEVEGRVMIYVHKETMLAEIEKRYPARHYVMIDDKLRILAAMKTVWGSRVTTIFTRQGHYAHDMALVDIHPPADLVIEHIDDLNYVDPRLFSGGESVVKT